MNECTRQYTDEELEELFGVIVSRRPGETWHNNPSSPLYDMRAGVEAIRNMRRSIPGHFYLAGAMVHLDNDEGDES